MVARIFDVVLAWVRHLLGRPLESKTLFTLEEGAQMRRDPMTPHGVVIDGGRVRLQPGVVFEVQDESPAVLREGRQKPIVGTFHCWCDGEGGCQVAVTGTEIWCGGWTYCSGECKMRVFFDQRVQVSGVTTP